MRACVAPYAVDGWVRDGGWVGGGDGGWVVAWYLLQLLELQRGLVAYRAVYFWLHIIPVAMLVYLRTRAPPRPHSERHTPRHATPRHPHARAQYSRDNTATASRSTRSNA